MSRRRRGSSGKKGTQKMGGRFELTLADTPPPTAPPANAVQVPNPVPTKQQASKASRAKPGGFKLARGYLIWSTFWSVLGPVFTVLGLFNGFQPDVEMVNQPAPDPTDFYTTPFQIHNASAFAIRNVRVTCDQMWKAKDLSAVNWKSSNRDPHGTIVEIARHERATASCYSPGPKDIQSSHEGAIFFSFAFQVCVVALRRHTAFCFPSNSLQGSSRVNPAADGHFHV